jgi:lipid II:glycine glycyltransferase (peptidoglycan interpeptide bridge formation enzyme)
LTFSTIVVQAKDVIQTYLHEVGHNLGLHHNKMGYYWNINTSWWPDEMVPLKVVKEKPKINLIEVRAAKAQKKLEEWQRKVKRASKLVKKYQCQVRYYEKKMAANNEKRVGVE